MRFPFVVRRVGAATVVLLATPALLAAQQSTSTAGAARGQGSSSGQGRGSSTTGTARQASTNRDDRARPQGFSVVLVLADLKAVPGEDDVPPAARKALLDMKEFLPYRSYRLVDASWILCCGNGRTTNRLRGPEDRDYELELTTQPADQSRLNVQFSLHDIADADDESPSARSRNTTGRSIAELERAAADAKMKLETARAKLAAPHPELTRLQADLQAAETRLAEARAAESSPDRQTAADKAARARTPGMRARSIMSTSFTMSLGETVVVGTSRLSGNSKALIALLTAVPPRTR
jgi:hypothetical protein